MTDNVPLSGADLISNEPLRPDDTGRVPDAADRFKHRVLAERVAQLIDAPGTHVNIAVNGPWGAGKSTFFELLRGELASRTTAKKKPRYTVVDFDAWQMADETFESNFLVTVARGVPGSPKNIEQRLFRANRTVNLPFGVDIPHRGLRTAFHVAVGIFLALFILGVPTLQAATDPALASATADTWWSVFLTSFVAKLIAWLTAAAGGTILVVLLGAATKLWSVSVQESGPAHVAQFRKLFSDIMRRASTTQVILVDELDRCAPDAVMRTLEGLRRFIGTEKCIFVVAFDRESVSATVQDTLERSVPTRDGRPYYSTAGEYLDKIFTYQVALPPQPRKAFRSYARALVSEKGDAGVWGELRARGQGDLDQVISILSPPHLTSPRRTKVILNDFAINARMVESFHGSWAQRAEEIAVLTVLQTEFPMFYADLEHSPNLLSHVADQADHDPGTALKPLVSKYRHGEVELDTVFSKDATRTNATLRAQLIRFLEKLRDMNVTLPRADLIQLGTGAAMLDFDDPAVFAVVEAATEVPRDETFAALRKASERDRFTAIDLILDDSEGETTAEAATLRIIAGTLLPNLSENQRTRIRPKIRGAWNRMHDEKSLTGLTVGALDGYTRALAPLTTASWAEGLLDAVAGDPRLTSNAVVNLADLTSASVFPEIRGTVLRAATEALLIDAGPLVAVLTRIERTGADAPGGEAGRHLFRFLAIAGNEVDEATYPLLAEAIGALVEFVDELPARSKVRRWLVEIFRSRAISEDSLDDYLAVVDAGAAHPGHARAVVDEALVAISLMSQAFQTELSTRVTCETRPSQRLIGSALLALLAIIAEDAEGEHADVLEAIAALSSFARPQAGIVPEQVLNTLDDAVRSVPSEDRPRFDQLLRVTRYLAKSPSLEPAATQLAATLIVEAVSTATLKDDLVHVLQGIQKQPSSVLRLVVDDLNSLLPAPVTKRQWAVRALLCAQIQLHELRDPVDPMTAQEIAPLLTSADDNTLLESWIRTGASGDDVLEALGAEALHTVPKKVWKDYVRRTRTYDTSVLWEAGVRHNEDSATLRVLAERGVTHGVLTAAANELAEASNTFKRQQALAVFRTLPITEETASALIPPLSEWLSAARVSEARMVEGLLLEYVAAFDADDFEQVQPLVVAWAGKLGKALPRASRGRLRDAGLLAKHS